MGITTNENDAELLRAAIAANASAKVRALLSKGSGVNAVDEHGDTPLLIAANVANVDTIGVIIDAGADGDAVDNRGNSVVHIACLRNDVEVLKFFIELKLNVDVANRNGRTALHLAVESSSMEIIRCLVDEGGASLEVMDNRDWSLLRQAIAADRLDVVEYLVEQGADVSEIDSVERTLLHYAVERASLPLIEYLIDQGVDVDAIDENERSVLHDAVANNRADVVELFASKEANLDVQNAFGRTPLFAAVINDLYDVARVLVDNGASLDIEDNDGKSLVRYAVLYASPPLLQFLEASGLEVDTVDEEGNSLLQFAVERGDVNIVASLVARGLDLKTANHSKHSLLHTAAKGSSLAVAEYLLNQGLDVHAVDENGQSPLHNAAAADNIEMVQLLLSRGALLTLEDTNGQTPIHAAISAGSNRVTLALLKRNVDLARYGGSLLTQAIAKQDMETVQFLWTAGVDINSVDESGDTILHHSATYWDMSVVSDLIARGAQVNAVNDAGETPLHVTVHYAFKEATELLLANGADPNAQDLNGLAPIHVAATDGYDEFIKVLVNKGADVNIRDKTQKTPLHTILSAIRPQSIEPVVRFLVAKGADVNAVATDGKTPLHRACKMGEKFNDMVQFLLENGAKDSTRIEDADGFCPLHIAARDLNVPLTKVLLDTGADVHLKNKSGQTPLCVAIFEDLRYGVGAFARANMAYALCTRGATWDASCEEALQQLRDVGDENDDSVVWKEGIKGCVLVWERERLDGTAQLTPVPLEVIERGEASVRIYTGDVKKSGIESLIYRRKICVVGPSEWGKTSLARSITTNMPCLAARDDRTVGIDLFASDFTVNDDSVEQNHEISFWDFAGQDIYQVAHTLFFSKRTLYLLCIDLEEYSRMLQQVESKTLRQAEATMGRFVKKHVFNWIRLIFVRQPDAEFVVVGTKADMIEAKDVKSIGDDLTLRISEWKRQFVAEIQEASQLTTLLGKASKSNDQAAPYLVGGQSARQSALQDLKDKAKLIASSQFISVSVVDWEQVERASRLLQYYVVSGHRSFAMPPTYSHVLQIVRKRREEAARMVTTKDRIENTVVPLRALVSTLMRNIDGLEHGDCVAVLRTLHDLGDILWYEREGSGALKDVIIIDPTLVLDYVREVVNHKHAAISSDETQLEKQGCVSHVTLSKLPYWRDSDEELTHAFKLLLQYFQLAYPADNSEMDWDSDLIVPTYWKKKEKASTSQRSLVHESSMTSRHGIPNPATIRWEYEISSEVCETVFEQFAVQSHTTLFKRTVSLKCIDTIVHGEVASHIELCEADGARDVIRVEVSAQNVSSSWNYMRFYVMAMEQVLDEYPGLVASRYIVVNSKRNRIADAVKAIDDATRLGKSEESLRSLLPWLPPKFEWFTQKAWRHPGALQNLRMHEQVQEAVSKVDVLRKLVVADDSKRRFPALWTVSYDEQKKKLALRMLSDLSGECFHAPLEIDVPPAFLAKYGAHIQTGLSILSNVVPEVVSLGILSKVIEFVSPVVGAKVQGAQVVHNLIDKLDVSSLKSFDSSTKSKLSPRGTVALLRDILRLHNDGFDESTLPDLAQLQCAATANGHFIWAGRQEIMALGDQLTPCDPIESDSSDSRSSATTAPSEVSTTVSPPVRLVITGIDGLSAWDWRKTYCKWRILHPSSSKPLASGVTSQHSDGSTSPSWTSTPFTIEGIFSSMEKLRECQLVVRVKRPSRCLGFSKLIGEGLAIVGAFIEANVDSCIDADVSIPLRTSGSVQHVVHCKITKPSLHA